MVRTHGVRCAAGQIDHGNCGLHDRDRMFKRGQRPRGRRRTIHNPLQCIALIIALRKCSSCNPAKRDQDSCRSQSEPSRHDYSPGCPAPKYSRRNPTDADNAAFIIVSMGRRFTQMGDISFCCCKAPHQNLQLAPAAGGGVRIDRDRIQASIDDDKAAVTCTAAAARELPSI